MWLPSRREFLALAPAALAAAGPPLKTTYTFKSAGRCEIRADVYRPEDGVVRPVLLWIHGGALIFGSRTNIPAVQLARYTGAGLAVVSIDYRLAPETKLPDILDDVRDAYLWVRSRGPSLFQIDPDRIAVAGHSAGGYLTLTCGYRFRPRPRALVSFYGYGDIAGDWYSRPDPYYSSQPAVPEEEAYRSVGREPVSDAERENQRFRFYLYCRQRGLWPREVTGRDPLSEPSAFDPWCPVKNVTDAYPPTLLLHGNRDTDVPFAQSERMAAELGRRGVAHELIAIAAGEHGFDRRMDDPAVSRAFARVIEFLTERLRPARYSRSLPFRRSRWQAEPRNPLSAV